MASAIIRHNPLWGFEEHTRGKEQGVFEKPKASLIALLSLILMQQLLIAGYSESVTSALLVDKMKRPARRR